MTMQLVCQTPLHRTLAPLPDSYCAPMRLPLSPLHRAALRSPALAAECHGVAFGAVPRLYAHGRDNPLTRRSILDAPTRDPPAPRLDHPSRR